MDDREPRFTALSWFAVGAGLTALVWIADMASGLGTTDAAWWVQISGRFNSGDFPYADFYMSVLPLPLYVTSAATAALGLELWVVKLLIDACFVATALLAARIALMVGIGRVGAGLVALASLSFAVLPSFTLYAPLSYLMLLASLAALLAWHRADGAARLIVVAGAAAGASAAGKQTVGAAALAALVVSAFAYSPRARGDYAGRARDAGLALCAATAVLALLLLPVALAGALDEMGVHAFEKGDYLRTGTVSYWEGLSSIWRLDAEVWTYRYIGVYALPFLAAAALGYAAVRHPRRELIPLALFSAAAVASAFPRADYLHVADAAPLCALAIAVALHGGPVTGRDRRDPAGARGRARAREGLAPAVGAVLVAVLAVSMLRAPIEQLSDGASRSELPHFKGVLVADETLGAARFQAGRLAAVDGGAGRTFVMGLSASFLYLVSGIENPTPYDFPVLETLRERGQSELIARLRSGELARICVGNFAGDPPQTPVKLQAFALSRLRPSAGGEPAAIGDYVSCEIREGGATRRAGPAGAGAGGCMARGRRPGRPLERAAPRWWSRRGRPRSGERCRGSASPRPRPPVRPTPHRDRTADQGVPRAVAVSRGEQPGGLVDAVAGEGQQQVQVGGHPVVLHPPAPPAPRR